MSKSTATVTTQYASRYLQQMCKHFGRKVPVEFCSETGHISLPFGSCALHASETQLLLKAETSEGNLDTLERVIGDHLARFAFRENPELAWVRAV
ncbi:MAG: DUF2218 domain-containing protein [Pseudomonadota bacterium]